MRITQSARILGLAASLLLTVSACDKGGDKGGDKTEAKTEAKTEVKTDDAHAGHGDDAAKPKVAEVAADGRVEIEVDAGGYHPAEIHAPANANITLAFKRITDQGCGQKIVVKMAEKIEKDLPLDEVVEIPVTVPADGELGFACGMDMYKGKVVPKS